MLLPTFTDRKRVVPETFPKATLTAKYWGGNPTDIASTLPQAQ